MTDDTARMPDEPHGVTVGEVIEWLNKHSTHDGDPVDVELTNSQTGKSRRIDIVSMSVTKYLGGTLHFSIHVEV